MRRATFLAALSALALAACDAPAEDAAEPDAAATAEPVAPSAAGEDAAGDTPMPTETTEPDGDTQCGADKLGEYVGQSPTDEVKAEIAEKVGDRPIRYYTQGDPITMDFNPARLNVELGEDGKIKVLRCG